VDLSAGQRLSFRRSGGLFAGNVLATSVSVDDELAPLVAQANLPELAGRSPIRGPGADVYQYELALEGDGPPSRVVVQQTAVPEQLRPLIERLERRAEAERGRG
jgi:hypothetical protein